MKKLMILLLILALGVTGCGVKDSVSEPTSVPTPVPTVQETYADKEFLQELSSTLQRKWDFPDETTKSVKVALELDALEKYTNEKYEDSKIQELAIQYINAVKDQKESLKYETVNYEKFTQLWDDAYLRRTELIIKFIDDYNLVMPEKYASIIDEFRVTNELVEENNKEKESIENFIDQIKFKKTKDSYGIKTYEAVVKNTTGYDFENMNLSINLLDEDKVIVQTTFANVGKYAKDAKVKFSFSTDKNFKYTDISVQYTKSQ